jgi:hypothetical protein
MRGLWWLDGKRSEAEVPPVAKSVLADLCGYFGNVDSERHWILDLQLNTPSPPI